MILLDTYNDMEKVLHEEWYQDLTDKSLAQLKEQITSSEIPIDKIIKQIRDIAKKFRTTDPGFVSLCHNSLSKFDDFTSFCKNFSLEKHQISYEFKEYVQLFFYFLGHNYWCVIDDGVVDFIPVTKKKFNIKWLKFIPELFPQYKWPRNIEWYGFNKPESPRKWASIFDVIFIDQSSCKSNPEYCLHEWFSDERMTNIILANEVFHKLFNQLYGWKQKWLKDFSFVQKIEFVSDYASTIQDYDHLRHLLSQALCFSLTSTMPRWDKQYNDTNTYNYEQILYPTFDKKWKISSLQKDVEKEFGSWDTSNLMKRARRIIDSYFYLFEDEKTKQKIIKEMKDRSISIIQESSKYLDWK